MPLEARTKPRNLVDAQFSIPWGVATAVARRRVTMEHFTEAAIKSPDILEVAGKIRVELDTRLDRSDRIPPGKLEIITKGGKVSSKQVDNPLGSPERPMSFDDCARKFRDCSSHPAHRLSNKHIERIIERTGQLEGVKDVREIIQLLN
jgi:2-methylcitrate dehydratase PrpD